MAPETLNHERSRRFVLSHTALPLRPLTALVARAWALAACAGVLAACAAAPTSSAGSEPSVTVPPPSAEPAPTAAPTAALSAAPGDGPATVVFPRIGASIRPLGAGKVEDAAKEATLRGEGFVFRLHREKEIEKVAAVADARRQIALRDAAEFGLRGLVKTADPPDDDNHTSVEEVEIGPREFLLADRAAGHVHVYVWRRSAEGGWVWADCRSNSLADLPRLRGACLTLATTR